MQKKYRLALITGSSSGLGKALVEECKKRGIKVYAPTRANGVDLTNTEHLAELAKWIEKNIPDLIINCAGKGLYGPMLMHPYPDQKELIDLNITALTKITYKAAEALRQEGKEGTIVNIASIASFLPMPSFAIYAASKAYVRDFSEALDVELSKDRIRVLCSCPGMFSSNFAKAASKGKYQKVTSHYTAKDLAKIVFQQIDRQKRLSLPFIRDKITYWLIKLFPKHVLAKKAEKSIRNRYRQ